jgi:cytidyltransferase-like protein
MSIIVVAGTFDPFHIGHETLLKAAFAHKESDSVLIGVMADTYVLNFKKREPTPYTTRAEIVKKYCFKIYKGKPFIIICVKDAIERMAYEQIKYIVLSTERDYTSWLKAVNDMRYTPIIPIFVDVVVDKNGNRLSSTNIREGKIDREGK